MPKEYIERSKAVEVIKDFGKGAIEDGQKTLDPVDDIILLQGAVGMIRSADVVEVKHSCWEKSNNKRTCKACGFFYYTNNDYFNYCPNCGAKMDGKDG